MNQPSGAGGFGYRPGLDGLRALSVLAVLGFHSAVFGAGWAGVDVFFALSGWLITGLVLEEVRRTDRISLKGFWARRARRLLPPLGVVLVLVTVLGAAGAVEVRRRGVVGAVTYSTNWLNIHGGRSYWDAFTAPDPLEHLWSLAIEEQIYVLWPLVLAALVAIGRVRVGARVVAGAVVAGSVAIAAHGATSGWTIDRLYQGTDTRACAFALGALFAGASLRRLGSWANHAVLIAALTLAWWLAREGARDVSMFEGRMALISVCGLVAVLAAAGIERGPLCHPVLRRLGLWSYGIYLFHRPVAVALEDWRPWPRFAAVLVAACAIAALSYRFVERPVREQRVPSVRLGLGAALVAATVAAAVVVAEPVAPPEEAVAEVTLPPVASTTTVAGGSSVPPTPRRLRVLILGDSVPALAGARVAGVGSALGFDVGVVAEPGCVPSPHSVDQYAPTTCDPFVARLGARIAATSPDLVMWWWGGTGKELFWDGVDTFVCEANGPAAIEARMRWLAGLSAGTPSVVVGPVPRTDLDESNAAGTQCEIDALVRAVPAAGMTLLRLDQFVCPSYPDRCDLVPRTDGLHYTDEGADEVATWLFTRLGEVLR